jgi:hypothetical protein
MTTNPTLFYWREYADGSTEYDTDVTLRDLFIGFALAGLLASGHRDRDVVSTDAIALADAVLAQREKVKP